MKECNFSEDTTTSFADNRIYMILSYIKIKFSSDFLESFQ